jgi:hypothetical protein
MFCGPGGQKLSQEFFQAFGTRAVAHSRRELDELMRQQDLFSGTAVADTWRLRLMKLAPRRGAAALRE